MNNSIHFFDLDNTLWLIETKAWIILKNKPNEPVIKLSPIKLNEIINGVHKKEDNMIEYNGQQYWISDEMFDKIKKRFSKIELSDIGLSFIEFTNPDYFKKLHFFVENIRHLIGKKGCDIGIISARYDVDNDSEVLKSLKDELGKHGLEIKKFYYVSKFFEQRNTNRVNIDKMKIILENIIGYSIEDDHFVPIKRDKYDMVHFYDEENQNVNVCNNIQYYMEEYLKHSDDEIYNKIINRIINNKPTLYTHLITNNKLNRFKTTEIKLYTPIKYAIKVDECKVYKYNEFINKLL